MPVELHCDAGPFSAQFNPIEPQDSRAAVRFDDAPLSAIRTLGPHLAGQHCPVTRGFQMAQALPSQHSATSEEASPRHAAS